ELAGTFSRAPFAFRHDLCTHPLLQLPRIIELSKELPIECVEYNAGTLALNQDPTLTPRSGLSIEETLRRIETCKSWMVLKNVQENATYRRLIDECLDQVQPEIERTDPDMNLRKAFIFVSSPGSVTPYHADFEYNFLLQVRGTKSIAVFDGDDRELLSEASRERIICGGQRNLPYRDAFIEKARIFPLGPGDGVHVPLSSPHWVRVGDEFSISLSITFQSRRSAAILAAHRVNARLRALGLTPTEVGRSPSMDAFKFTAYRALRKVLDGSARLRKQ
ncbi:MAG TPA: hypothetical protein VGC55_14465, partial [Dokdonella sp.]